MPFWIAGVFTGGFTWIAQNACRGGIDTMRINDTVGLIELDAKETIEYLCGGPRCDALHKAAQAAAARAPGGLVEIREGDRDGSLVDCVFDEESRP
jgi:hypothetical protein